MQLLAGDVGATKTKLAIFSSDDPHISAAQESTFPNVEYSSLDTLVQEFLSKVNDSIEFACFGVAGPIFQGSAKLTNLAWVIDEKELSASLKLASVRLLNDLQATAYYVPFLKPKEIETLNRGKPIYGGTIAVIAPGTGLGEAYLAWDGKRYHPHASEGGHGDFAPTNPSEIDLLSHLLSKFKHVSYERVCSGRGLYNIYKYYHESTQSRANGCPAEDKISEADDPTPPIVDAALHKKSKCGICVKTLDMFISILGAEAGNLGLKFMATSGVYVGGGIPPRILSFLKEERFMRAFLNKGRMTELASRMPVNVILDSRVALLGAARFGLDTMSGDGFENIEEGEEVEIDGEKSRTVV